MDLLFWNQKRADLKLVHTTNLFFNEYVYRLVVHAPRGRYAYLDGDIAKHHQEKYANATGYLSRFGAPIVNTPPVLAPIDIIHIENIRTIRKTIPDIKIHVEFPYVQLYAKSEAHLKDICDKYIDPSAMVSLSFPESERAESALLTGGCIKKSSKFKYKLHVPAQKVKPEIKDCILAYLEDHPDAKITESLHTALIGAMWNKLQKHTSIWRTVIYTNDESVALYLSLLCPGFINKIQIIHQP